MKRLEQADSRRFAIADAMIVIAVVALSAAYVRGGAGVPQRHADLRDPRIEV